MAVAYNRVSFLSYCQQCWGFRFDHQS